MTYKMHGLLNILSFCLLPSHDLICKHFLNVDLNDTKHNIKDCTIAYFSIEGAHIIYRYMAPVIALIHFRIWYRLQTSAQITIILILASTFSQYQCEKEIQNK